MRAFTIYNDIGTVGVSIIATLPDDAIWKTFEVQMEDHIGPLTSFQDVVDKVSEFTILFPDPVFIRARAYNDLDRSQVREDEDDTFSDRGYKIYNPENVLVKFKERPVQTTLADVVE